MRANRSGNGEALSVNRVQRIGQLSGRVGSPPAPWMIPLPVNWNSSANSARRTGVRSVPSCSRPKFSLWSYCARTMLCPNR